MCSRGYRWNTLFFIGLSCWSQTGLQAQSITIFINDIDSATRNSSSNIIQCSFNGFFPLLFADDVALASDIVIGLQMQLNALYTCSRELHLQVNTDKTKLFFPEMVGE